MLKRFGIVASIVAAVLFGGVLWRQMQPTMKAPVSAVTVQACGVITASSVPAAIEIPLSKSWPKVELHVGQTVAWVNDTAKTQLLESPPGELTCAGFESAQLLPGQEVRLTLLHSGHWLFAVKDGIRGAVVVE
jgi:hypothetical protein